MSNVRIIAPNEADDCVLSASPAMVATLPVEYLQDQTRARVARSTGLHSPQYIRGTFNAVKLISAFCVDRHNLTGAGTLRLKLWDDVNQTGTLLADITVNLGNPTAWGDLPWGVFTWGDDVFADWPVAFSVLWFTPVRALSFELQITDLANTNGYYEAARLFLGLYWSPVINMSYAPAMSWIDNSVQERTSGGSLRTDAEDPYRRWEFDLRYLSVTERGTLAELLRRNGKRQDLFLSMFPEEGGQKERDYAGRAKLIEVPGISHDFLNNFRTAQTLVFEEA